VALPDIVLDDRRFDEIVAEARRRIPGYTPEWTDLNESDPGITLVQLFAWLSEMIIWRLNRVPDKSFIKFLDLLGLELREAVPARAELTFKLSAPNLGQVVTIPKGTKVALAEAGDAGPVVFETDDNPSAVSGSIAAIQSFDGAQYDLVSEASRLARHFVFPFGERPQKGAALFLGLTEPFPRGRHTLTVHAYTSDLLAEGRSAAGGFGDLAPPVQGRWEFWAGDTAAWRPLAVASDTTLALTRTGTVTFDAPTAPDTMQKADKGLGLLKKPDDPPLFWLRYLIEDVLGPGFEIVPRLEDVLLNTISATNAVTIRDELLGASDGTPNQRMRLVNTPVLPGTLRLEVQENADEDFQPWDQVKDLNRSGPDDRHYVLNAATGEILFGNGSRGRIPPVIFENRPGIAGGQPSAQIANVRAREYRFGGGAAGNAGAGKITSLEDSIPFVESVTNARPAEGGENAETLDDAKIRAPLEIRSRSRAVTAEDFEFLARQTPGARIRRAKALPLHHPEIEPRRPAGSTGPVTRVPVPGVVTVLVVPESRDRLPVLREETRNRVLDWLNRHRLISTEVFVRPPRFRKVEIEVRVTARADADTGRLQRELLERLLRYFHPLTGGEEGTGWDFGRSIFFSETYRQFLNVDGVLRLTADALTTYVDGVKQPGCADVALADDELVWSDTHRIEVRYA
jgi:predicted phage baseplate assembly protein